MLVHDLKSIGLLADGDAIDPPLPATDALINYLYGVALRDGPIARLGYSYWAESAYEHIGPLLVAIRKSLSLTDRNMTFFAAHSAIDVKHAEEVRKTIGEAVVSPDEADAVVRVATTTLWLTMELLDQALDASTCSGSMV
jgi:pyrroloquinoline quinone (PQQ) biosynthesis protein C